MPDSGKPWRAHLLPLLFVLIASLAAVSPLVRLGPSCGHDFDFHLLSWIETVHDWHLGIVYPHWLVTANYGAGEPRFVFYPPVSWFLGAGMGGALRVALGQRAAWTSTPILFTWVSIWFAGSTVYRLICSFASRVSATVAACLFVVNPYLLFVAYERTAFAELLATGLIALLLLLALREVVAIGPTALVIATLWLTNAPAAVMGCYLLAAVALLRIVFERRFGAGLRAGFSCLLGTALASFYLIPAAFEQRWVQIERAVSEGMRIEDSFLFEHTGLKYHDQVLHTASVITAVLMITGFASALIVWRSRSRGTRQGRLVAVFMCLLAGLLFLQLRVSDFVWLFAPRLKFLQFPWRWLVVVSIVAASLLAMALDRVKWKRMLPFTAGLLVVGSIWICSHNFYNSCDVDDSVGGQLTSFHDGSGVQGTDEYTAKGADNSEVLQDIPPVRVMTAMDAELPPEGAGDNPEWISDWNFPTTAKATTKIEEWSPQHRRIVVQAAQPAFAVLTLMNYPAWDVRLNGSLNTDHGQREDGLIALAVPAGTSTIDVSWRTTPDMYWGRGISAVTALLLLMIWWMDQNADPATALRSGRDDKMTE